MASQTETRPTNPASAQKAPSRLGWVSGAIVVVIVVGGALWWLWPAEHKKMHAAPGVPEHSAGSAEDEDAARVEVEKPQAGGITRKSTQVGSVHAFQEAPLYAKASGYLKTLSVDIGDRVTEGQELAVIDDPELVKERDLSAAELRQSKTAVKTFEAAVKSYKASVDAATARVEQAKADIDRYTATRKYREKELARYQGLYEQRAVPKSVVDEEEEHLESARASERAAHAAVGTALADLNKANADVMQAEADLLDAKAKVEVADERHQKFEVLVNYLKIVSPYTGVVLERNVHPGYFIRSASDGTDKPLLTVARTDKMRIVTYVPDRDVPYVDVHDKAEVALDALNTSIPGEVWRFADFEDPDSRTMRTEILLDNKDGKIRQGMYGLATINLGETKAALTIPTGCLVGESKSGKGAIYIVRDGKAKRVEIKIGADDGIRLEVLKGLTADDQVITNVSSVTDGSPVIISEPAKAAPKAGAVGH